jgi:hypothetical protein
MGLKKIPCDNLVLVIVFMLFSETILCIPFILTVFVNNAIISYLTVFNFGRDFIGTIQYTLLQIY